MPVFKNMRQSPVWGSECSAKCWFTRFLTVWWNPLRNGNLSFLWVRISNCCPRLNNFRSRHYLQILRWFPLYMKCKASNRLLDGSTNPWIRVHRSWLSIGLLDRIILWFNSLFNRNLGIFMISNIGLREVHMNSKIPTKNSFFSWWASAQIPDRKLTANNHK